MASSTGSAPSLLDFERLEALGAFLEERDILFAEPNVARAWLDRPLGVLEGRSRRQLIIDSVVHRVTGVLDAPNAGAALLGE